MRSLTCFCPATNRTSRAVSSPFSLRAPSTTTSVPTPDFFIMRLACGEAVGRLDGVGIGNDAVLGALDDLHFAHLRGDVAAAEAAVDDAEAAFFGLDDRHRRARDGVHVGRDDRMLQRDVLGEAGGEIDRFGIAALEDAEPRREQKIIKGAAADGGQQIGHAAIIARLISCTPFEYSPHSIRRSAFGLLVLVVAVRLKPDTTCCCAQGGPITVLSREGRRTLPAVDVQGHQMVGLDDLATLFQLQVREDAAARAITATYKNQTIVLTPDQSLVSSSGRLVSLPAPRDAPQQPVAGAGRIHQPRARAHLRRPARLPPGLAAARRRRSARAARDGAVRRRARRRCASRSRLRRARPRP